MPYNETFEKLKAAQNPAFAEEIEAVKDNQTFFIGAYESSLEGNIPKGDFNEIFQALLNNDKALKKLAEAIQARTITAGKGLQGGGALSEDVTLNVVSVNDAIIVNDNDIQLNPVNDLTTGGAYKALSGEMGKKLDTDKPSKNKEETITNYWTFEGRTPFIKFKKTGEQSLPSAGYSAFIGFGSSARPHELQINNLYDDGTVDIKSADLKTENKNITKAINEVYDNQLGNTGILEVIYIQDSGTKTKGLGYVDKITKKVYLCINTNTDTSITSNFILATNVDTARKVDDMIGSSTKLELKEGDYFICSAAFIQLSGGMVFVSGTFRLKSNYTYNRKLPDWAIPKTKQNLFMTALSSASSQNVSTLGFVVDTDGYVKTEYGYSGNNVTGSWIYSIR